MISFSIFGIPVRVLPWFWITMALVGGVLRGVDSKESFLRLLLFMVAGFISILVHELGHGLTAKKFGQRVHIVLQAFGGYAAYTGAPVSRPRSFMITAAGPAIQIVLGVIALIVLRNSAGMAPNGQHFIWALAWVSIIWAVLNLLPVLPLDGGRLVESVLGPRRIKLTLGISALVGLVVCILSITVFSQPFLAVFLGMFAYQSFQALKQVP